MTLSTLVFILSSSMLTPRSTIKDCQFQAIIVYDVVVQKERRGVAWWQWLKQLHEAPLEKGEGWDNAYKLGYSGYSMPTGMSPTQAESLMFSSCEKALEQSGSEV